MKKISIVIPYYETYELTEKILRELEIQMKYGVEVIVIDDGCNETRLDKYRSPYIKVIHQENMGVAKSRNKGIDLARGEYIGFIDCDDQITMDYVDTLLNAIKEYKTDIINFNWYDMTYHQEYRKPHNYAPWKAIYKKSIIPPFREDREYGSEDIDFQELINKWVESKTVSITYLDKILYLYNSNREGSLYWKSTHQV